ncbi:MAG: hypothetical protein AB8B60_00400 [Sulfitobacter sp.]
MTDETNRYSDETLTAYLDGELDVSEVRAVEAALATDENLSARLAALDLPLDALRRAMGPAMLDAPEIPASLLVEPPRARMGFAAPLALAASFVLGVGITTYMQPEPKAPAVGWLASVASYQALYVTETLSGATQDSASTTAVLTRAGAEFGVALDPATQIDGMEFKRAQILGFKGKPLLQMAYLTPDGTPLALCLVSTGNEDRGPKPTVMFDLAGVSWVRDGVGYFLVGGTDTDLLNTLTGEIRAAI